MERERDLIVVHGNLYSYDKYDEDIKMHKVAEVEIDEDGILTATYIPAYFTEEELLDNSINLSQKQWIGLVEHIIRQSFSYDPQKISEVAEDIVTRCFVYGLPTVEELPQYIEDYLLR